MSLLLTGIAELTTNDPARADGHGDRAGRGDALLGIVRDAALVVSGGQHRLGDVGRLLGASIHRVIGDSAQ